MIAPSSHILPICFFLLSPFSIVFRIIRYFELERSWLTLRCLAQRTCEHQHLWGVGLEDTWTTEEQLESGESPKCLFTTQWRGMGNEWWELEIRMSITSGIYWDHPGVTSSYLDGPYIFATRTWVFFLGGKLCKPEKIGVFLRNSMLHRHGMKRMVKEPPQRQWDLSKNFPKSASQKACLCPLDVFS